MNDKRTKYTFLLPAYKEKYLQIALLRIKQQTFPDLLVVVSDDCSPENIKGVFNDCVARDKRFTYRRNETNMGGKSLLTALMISRTFMLVNGLKRLGKAPVSCRGEFLSLAIVS